MIRPLAICIEDLDAKTEAAKYLRCVALPGRQPGLRLDEAGRVLWQADDVLSCELWISADDRLILHRQEGMEPVILRRGARSLDVPFVKPVVVLDKDQIEVGSRHLRVHIHGEATSVAAPAPLPPRSRMDHRVAQTVAAAALLGAVATTGGCIGGDGAPTPTIEVREDVPAEYP
jgi:hypothetical protein